MVAVVVVIVILPPPHALFTLPSIFAQSLAAARRRLAAPELFWLGALRLALCLCSMREGEDD